MKLIAAIILVFALASCGESTDYANKFPTTTVDDVQASSQSTVVVLGGIGKPGVSPIPPTITTTTTIPPTTTTTNPPTTAPPVTAAVNHSGSGQLGDPYFIGSWHALADCECGGNWGCNTGNGYYGGLQFALSSWQMVGGAGYPHQASVDEQIKRGIMLYEMMGGWQPWPHCTREVLGWR